jgi:hypothetical protein
MAAKLCECFKSEIMRKSFTMKREAEYTLFVGESGDTGSKKVRTAGEDGASTYTTLGAALIKNEDLKRTTKFLADIVTYLGKENIHCSKRDHFQKVFLIRNVAKAPVTFFGVISKKETLREYKEEIDSSHTMYYNKSSQYLLEKIGKYVELNALEGRKIDIVFEEGGYDYNGLRDRIRACILTPYHQEAMYLRHIDPNIIVSKNKEEEPLLQIANIVAHSLFKCTDKSAANYQTPETCYMAEIRSKFFCDPKGTRIEGFGLKATHSYKELDLDEEVIRVFEPK